MPKEEVNKTLKELTKPYLKNLPIISFAKTNYFTLPKHLNISGRFNFIKLINGDIYASGEKIDDSSVKRGLEKGIPETVKTIKQ